MQRIQIKRAIRRGFTGSTLAAALAFAPLAQAESTQRDAGTTKGQQTSADARSNESSHDSRTSSGLSGLSRDQIKDIQRELATRGLYQGNIDGIAGAKTQAALRNFQTQQGIAVGSVDARTRDALGVSWDRVPVSGSDSGQASQSGSAAATTSKSAQGHGTDGSGRQSLQGNASRAGERQGVSGTTDVQSGRDSQGSGTQLSSLDSDQIKQMQQRLQSEGLYQGEIDGVLGGQTRMALKRFFQRQAQLVDQGLVSSSAMSLFSGNQ